MTDGDYVVIRAKNSSIGLRGDPVGMRSRSGFRTGRRSPEGDDPLLANALVEVEPDRVTVDTERLSARQAQAEAADPDSIVVQDMPVELIAPVATATAAASGRGVTDPVATAKQAKIAWGVAAVGAGKSEYTGDGVRVAVLDTGIDPEHPAFEGIDLTGATRKNFTQDGPDDRNGHGTHCAGTIFGRNVDDVRIGVAPGVVDVSIAKVLDDRGRGSTSNVLRALHWAAVERRANIISLSLGFDFPAMQQHLVAEGRRANVATSMALKAYRETLRAFETLVALVSQETAQSPGVVIVAAAGNESEHPDVLIDASMPAAASLNVLSVGAMMEGSGNYGIAPFSNINPSVCAPGLGIVSAKAGTRDLVSLNGTSMACPHVAGVAALWWQRAEVIAGKATGMNVRGAVTGRARPDVFPAALDFATRGAGLVVAPSSAS